MFSAQNSFLLASAVLLQLLVAPSLQAQTPGSVEPSAGPKAEIAAPPQPAMTEPTKSEPKVLPAESKAPETKSETKLAPAVGKSPDKPAVKSVDTAKAKPGIECVSKEEDFKKSDALQKAFKGANPFVNWTGSEHVVGVQAWITLEKGKFFMNLGFWGTATGRPPKFPLDVQFCAAADGHAFAKANGGKTFEFDKKGNPNSGMTLEENGHKETFKRATVR